MSWQRKWCIIDRWDVKVVTSITKLLNGENRASKKRCFRFLNGSFKNCLHCSFGNPKWFFYVITVKIPLFLGVLWTQTLVSWTLFLRRIIRVIEELIKITISSHCSLEETTEPIKRSHFRCLRGVRCQDGWLFLGRIKLTWFLSLVSWGQENTQRRVFDETVFRLCISLK